MANRTATETVRDQRLALSILNEYILNGQQSLAATQIGAVITALQTLQTAIGSATDQTITTL